MNSKYYLILSEALSYKYDTALNFAIVFILIAMVASIEDYSLKLFRIKSRARLISKRINKLTNEIELRKKQNKDYSKLQIKLEISRLRLSVVNKAIEIHQKYRKLLKTKDKDYKRIMKDKYTNEIEMLREYYKVNINKLKGTPGKFVLNKDSI